MYIRCVPAAVDTSADVTLSAIKVERSAASLDLTRLDSPHQIRDGVHRPNGEDDDKLAVERKLGVRGLFVPPDHVENEKSVRCGVEGLREGEGGRGGGKERRTPLWRRYDPWQYKFQRHRLLALSPRL